MLHKIKKGSGKPYLAIKLKKVSDGSAWDLTNATIKFYMRNADTDTLKVNGAVANVTGEANGEFEYRFTAADTDTSGNYEGEFKITFADTSIMKIPVSDEEDDKIKIKISESVD